MSDKLDELNKKYGFNAPPPAAPAPAQPGILQRAIQSPITQGALTGLQHVGNALDVGLGARSLRSGLMGDWSSAWKNLPGIALFTENEKERNYTGREINEKLLGIQNDPNSWLAGGAGLASEILLDPSNLLGGLGVGTKLAKSLDVVGDAVKGGAKVADLLQQTDNVGDAARALQQAGRLDDLSKGATLADRLRRGETALATLNVPFTKGELAITGKSLGIPDAIEGAGKLLGKAGSAIAKVTPEPLAKIGGGLRDIGRSARVMFDTNAKYLDQHPDMTMGHTTAIREIGQDAKNLAGEGMAAAQKTLDNLGVKLAPAYKAIGAITDPAAKQQAESMLNAVLSDAVELKPVGSEGVAYGLREPIAQLQKEIDGLTAQFGDLSRGVELQKSKINTAALKNMEGMEFRDAGRVEKMADQADQAAEFALHGPKRQLANKQEELAGLLRKSEEFNAAERRAAEASRGTLRQTLKSSNVADADIDGLFEAINDAAGEIRATNIGSLATEKAAGRATRTLDSNVDYLKRLVNPELKLADNTLMELGESGVKSASSGSNVARHNVYEELLKTLDPKDPNYAKLKGLIESGTHSGGQLTTSVNRMLEQLGMKPAYDVNPLISAGQRQADAAKVAARSKAYVEYAKTLPYVQAGPDSVNALEALTTAHMSPKLMDPDVVSVLKDKYIPKTVAAQLIKYERELPKKINAVLEAYTDITKLGKGALTAPNPAYQAENFLGSTYFWLSESGPKGMVENMAKAYKLMRGHMDDITLADGTKVSQADLLRKFAAYEIQAPYSIMEKMGGKNIAMDSVSGFRAATAPDLKSVFQHTKEAVRHPIQKGHELGQFVDSWFRTAYALKLISEGETNFATMAKKINGIFMDFSDLTDAEKAIRDYAIPFYTFRRRVIPLQLKLIAHNPRAANFWMKSFGMNHPDKQMDRPGWAREGLYMPWGKDKATGNQRYKGIDLPLAEPFTIPQFHHGNLVDNITKTMQKLGGNLNFMPKYGIERMMKGDMFKGQDLEKLNKVEAVWNNLPEPVLEKLGMFKDKYGNLRTDKPYFAHLMRTVPTDRLTTLVMRLTDAGINLNEEPEKAANAIMDLLLGTKTTEVDPDLLEDDMAKFRKRQRTLEGQTRVAEIEYQDERQKRLYPETGVELKIDQKKKKKR